MKILITLIMLLPGILSDSLVANAEAERRKTRISISGDEFLINGRTAKLWGIRMASATINETYTEEVLKNLRTYKAHGINCISIYLMGSSGGADDPFSPDGKEIDIEHRRRAERIIEQLDRLEMVCIVGIFYQNVGVYGGTKKLTGWYESVEAVRTVAEWLDEKAYTNVILNIANEQNSKAYDDDPWSGVKDIDEICRLCSIVDQVAPSLITGAGGYHEENNKKISRCPYVDVLLYDTTDPAEGDYYTDQKLYDSYRQNFSNHGINPKPLFNVEQFGAYSQRFEPPQGYYEKYSDAKTYYYKCIDIAFDNKGLNTMFHANVWYQGARQNYPNRFDPGGSGSESDPGVHWYFDYLQKKLRKNKK